MLHCHARDGGSPVDHVYRRVAEPVEELEEVTLDELRPKWTTRMGTLARSEERRVGKECLE